MKFLKFFEGVTFIAINMKTLREIFKIFLCNVCNFIVTVPVFIVCKFILPGLIVHALCLPSGLLLTALRLLLHQYLHKTYISYKTPACCCHESGNYPGHLVYCRARIPIKHLL